VRDGEERKDEVDVDGETSIDRLRLRPMIIVYEMFRW
jgi:hypothetical protein